MRRVVLVATLVLAAAVPAPAATLRSCGDGYRCARIAAPLDYGDPGGTKIRLNVAVRPARDRTHRVGALFVNYGGPGADAVRRTRSYGYRRLHALGRRFDIVAVDPRGTGGSRPAIDCHAKAGLYRPPFARVATANRRREVARARAYAKRCAAQNPVLAGHLSTANAARDIDTVRAALGYETISYLGYSYGTLLGATYAALFPDRARAVVLDGPVDPRTWLSDPLQGSRDQTAGFERALGRYFAACRSHPRACRWARGRSPRAAYDRLVRRADRHPISAHGAGARVDGDTINAALADDLYAKQLWREISSALDRAARGDAALLRIIADDFIDAGGPSLDRFFMITSADARYPTDPGAYFAAARQAEREDPHFFFNRGFGELPFAFGTRDPDAFYGPFTLPATTTPALVVATTFDPATPYAQGRALAASLGRAQVLTMRGDGHTAYGGESPCVDKAVEAYVNRLSLPRPGRACVQRTKAF